MNEKIFTYIDDVSKAYGTSISILDGLDFNQQDTLTTIEFYRNNKYLSGNKDGLGRDKPFYNVNNYRVRVAKVASDIDISNLKVEGDRQKDFGPALILNTYFFKWMKESNFSKVLNEMGETRPAYGGVVVKKCIDEGKLEIEVVDWKNLIFSNLSDLLSGSVIETHYLTPQELSSKKGIWDDKAITDTLQFYKKKYRGKLTENIEIKEIHGLFPEDYDLAIENPDDTNFVQKIFFVACFGRTKYLLHSDNEKELPYKYCEWERVPGRGLGRGIVEEGFESQVWTNDAMINLKNAMELAGKVVLWTNSEKVGGNVLSEIDNGHVFELGDGKTINSLNLIPSALPEYSTLINLWKDQFDRSASTFDANVGEQPPSGTPLGQTQILNAVSNSPFEYQREVWGIWLNEIINDWIFPYLIKQIKKEKTLVSEFDEDELKALDESFALSEANDQFKKKILRGEKVYMEDYINALEAYKAIQGQLGRKRYIDIPDGYFDNFKGKVTVNITGEQKNKQAVLQSLNTLMMIYAQNPQLVNDPRMAKMFGILVEMSGVPLSPMDFSPDKSQPSPLQPQQPNVALPKQMQLPAKQTALMQ